MENRWDSYFHAIASVVADNSRCLSIQIGAILVKDRSIIATGYNGPARGVPECGKKRLELDDRMTAIARTTSVRESHTNCPRYMMGARSGEMLDYCIAAHAETNCICNAARMGVNTSGSTMYMTCGIPCRNCLSNIINAGISEIVCANENLYDNASDYILNNSHLEVRTYGTLL